MARCGPRPIPESDPGRPDSARLPQQPRAAPLVTFLSRSEKFMSLKILINILEDKNPKANNSTTGTTALHEAANNGHEEICNMILGKVENKNPKDNIGNSKFHDDSSKIVDSLLK